MKIDSIVHVSTQGFSRPYVCSGDDGYLYWCKGNHTGLRAVISEWMCAQIAHALALPVPMCFISKFDPIDHNNAFCKTFDPQEFANEHILRRFYAQANPNDIDCFKQEFRDKITSTFLDNIWSEMPIAWTDVDESVFSLEEVKNILVGGRE